MRRSPIPALCAVFALIVALAVGTAAAATERLRFAIQKTGTAAWEIALIKARGLDTAADLELDVTELASTDAGKIALQGGAADMIVSDWLWVARERALGDRLLFAPYSSAVGAVVMDRNSPVRTIADLASHSLGVAGGPLDKSWLLLRAAAKRQGVDLAGNPQIAYGAPPLIMELGRQGAVEAIVQFWNFCAELESRGDGRLRTIEIADVEISLGASAPVAMTGYVFSEQFAVAHKDALRRYFAAAAKARTILAEDPSAWLPIQARLKLTDAAALAPYRRRYLDGVPKRSISEEAADARVLFAALAEVGGRELVGEAKEFDPSLYYDPNTGR